MDSFILTICVASLATYALASRFWFCVPNRIAEGMRLVEVSFAFGGVLHTWGLLQGSASRGSAWAAVVFYAAGLGVFALACKGSNPKKLTMAFTPDAPSFVIQTGIYRKIRHPFYLAYCLTWVGGAVATLSPTLFAFALWMVLLYFTAARIEETKFLRSPLAEEYSAYRKRTGMFWPRLGPPRGGD